MLKRVAKYSIISVSLVILIGCSKQLDRVKAGNLIEKSLSHNDMVVYDGPKNVQCAGYAGLVNPRAWAFALTAEGAKYFKKASVGWPFTNNNFAVTFRDPPRPKVLSVDGIADLAAVGGGDPTLKQVEYTLEYDFSNVKLPPAAMPCFTPSGPMHGRAILQLFDDGWRVQSAPLPLAQIDPAVIQEASAAAAQAKNFSYLGVQPININHGINKINSTNFGYAKSTFPSVYQSIGVRVDDVYINKSGDVIVVKLDLSEFDLENYASVKDALAKTGRWKIVAECAHEGCI